MRLEPGSLTIIFAVMPHNTISFVNKNASASETDNGNFNYGGEIV